MKKLVPTFVICISLLAACGAPPLEGGAGEEPVEEPQEAPAAEEPPFEDEIPTSAPAMPVDSPRPSFPETALTFTPAPQSMNPLSNPAQPSLTFSPILFRRYVDHYYSFQLLGAYADGTWMKDEDVFDNFAYEQAVDVYDLNGFYGNTLIHDITELAPPYCGSMYIGSDMDTSSGWQFAFYQGWQVTQRPWTDISVDSDYYMEAVADWLSAQGIAAPNVQITRVVRVDLEGDGIDEVFISASYFKSPNPESPLTEYGDYSIVLLRKVSGDAVITLPVVADVYHFSQPEAAYPYTYLLSSFLDLNQDGNLEVILDVTRWEGYGILVFEIKGSEIIQALTEICAE
jgi:hypothetical protein